MGVVLNFSFSSQNFALYDTAEARRFAESDRNIAKRIEYVEPGCPFQEVLAAIIAPGKPADSIRSAQSILLQSRLIRR